METIIIEKLTEKDVGRNVTYRPPFEKHDEGVITSWNRSFVFVRYGSDKTSKATPPSYLFFDNK